MKKYNITGMRGQYRYILMRDLSYEDAIDLKNTLNTKNEWVKASLSYVGGVLSQNNVPVDEIIKEWQIKGDE